MEEKEKTLDGPILIVDDDAGVLKMLGTFLGRKGFMVHSAESGKDALRILAQNPPELILLDVNMPEMDGITTLKKIREVNAKIPVIMITGLQEENIAREAVSLGAYAYVVKPFDLNYLAMTVSTALLMED